MEQNNENKKIEELSEEQLKEVTGGKGFCSYIDGCKRQSDREPCVCYEWEDGYVHKTNPLGKKVCEMEIKVR